MEPAQLQRQAVDEAVERNVRSHLDKIREAIKANNTAKQANVIRLFNLILRGWANYHSHVVTKKTFARARYHCLVINRAMGGKGGIQRNESLG
ncbi:group II intron maturase-specific domain-containing protein [Candidatus Methylobacter favarea]|uniref:group II intron maturase-specific domain-containing protein n=1 Tax=Candidatus Methylobacter favarea TaxID=2707345 RepID=UPI003CCE38CC